MSVCRIRRNWRRRLDEKVRGVCEGVLSSVPLTFGETRLDWERISKYTEESHSHIRQSLPKDLLIASKILRWGCWYKLPRVLPGGGSWMSGQNPRHKAHRYNLRLADIRVSRRDPMEN